MPFSTTAPRFDDRLIAWRPFGANSPLNADGANPSEGLMYWVLGVDRKRGIVDMLFRMAPGAMCTPHRHLGRTTTLVIEGEHRNIAEVDGNWAVKDVRPPGMFAFAEGDHLHREQAGPEAPSCTCA